MSLLMIVRLASAKNLEPTTATRQATLTKLLNLLISKSTEIEFTVNSFVKS